MLDIILNIVVSGSATVIAAVTVGAYRLLARFLQRVERHDRLLLGEDAVDGWDGIVPMVERHRTVLREEDLIDEGEEDRGSKRWRDEDRSEAP